MKKKVLLIVNNPTKYETLAKSFSNAYTYVSVCSYKNLAFYIDGDNSFINCYTTNENINTFSKIIVLSTSPFHLQNYIFSALACYCRKHKITIIDDSFSNTDGKLYSLWRFWEKSIPVAKTAFGPVDFLAQKLADFGGEGVLKSVQGTKGKDNYLVHSETELRDIINDNPDVNFILQEYIPNDGDWRIILTNFEPKLAIYRSSHGKDFRNNTSVGGEATLIPLEKVDSTIVQLAIKASKALNIKLAGADVLPSKTGEYTILEVNRTPQLATGAFTEVKKTILKNLICDE